MYKTIFFLLFSFNVFLYSFDRNIKDNDAFEKEVARQFYCPPSPKAKFDKDTEFESIRQKLISGMKDLKSGSKASDSLLEYAYQTVLEFLLKNKGNGVQSHESSQDKIEFVKRKKEGFDKLKFWRKNERNINYKFTNVNAIIPEQLYLIIDALQSSSMLLPRFILHGPPGNGKTTLMREIALELNAEFIEVHTPGLVTKFQGSGAENIRDYFHQAMEILLENKKVVLFFDEIDAICPKDNERYQDHKSTLQTLWLWLDRVKDIPGIYTVFATNNFANMNKAFVSRFDSNIVEIKDPCEYARRNVIAYYFKKFNESLNVSYDEPLIDKIAGKTGGLSLRSIEGVVRLVCQKASKNNGKIDIGFVDESIITQKKIYVAIKTEEDKKDKRSILEKTQSIAVTTGTILGILITSYQIYKRYQKYKGHREFWDTAKNTMDYVGLKSVAEFFEKHEISINKLRRYFRF